MKKLLLSAVAAFAVLTSNAQNNVTVTNNSNCDVYINFYAWGSASTSIPPFDHTSAYFIPANSSLSTQAISSLAWSGTGGTSCGFAVGVGGYEDISCGTGATAQPTAPNGNNVSYVTTCSGNPGCPANTTVQIVSAPVGQPCGSPGFQGSESLDVIIYQ